MKKLYLPSILVLLLIFSFKKGDSQELLYEPVPYGKLTNSAFINDYSNKRVSFTAMFLGSMSSSIVGYYSLFKIKTDGNVFINHRDISYVSENSAFGSSDISLPPIGISIDKDRSDIVFNLKRGEMIEIKGLAVKMKSTSGEILHIKADDIQKKSRQENERTNLDVTLNAEIKTPPSFSDFDGSLPKYYSLIIGVNDYQFKDERLHNLDNPIRDANSFNSILIGKFNFSTTTSIFLSNPTRQQIIKQLEKLASTITIKDNLLIFFAGHGFWDEKLKIGYWLPSDANSTDKSNWISNSTIRDYISGIASKHTLLITDACFGGSIFKTREMNLSENGVSNLYRLNSRKAITSGTLTTVPDESKFMYYLMKRLTDSKEKYISSNQLFYGIETAILNNSSTLPQFGVIQDTGDEGGDFIFIKK